jgi:hypothetical protein
MPGKAPIVALLAVLAAVSRAQDPAKNPLGEKDVLALHQSGLAPAEILAAIERNGAAPLDEPAVGRLKAAGLPAEVLARVAPPAKAAPAPMSVADIVNLARSGVPEEAIVDAIVSTNSRFEVSVDQVVDLVREGVPAGVIKVMRERSAAAATADVVQEAKSVTLDDVLAMAQAGLDAGETIKRIRRADATFAVTTDDLIRLSRAQVSVDVLREVWRRRSANARDPAPATAPKDQPAAEGPGPKDGGGEPGPSASPGVELVTHREPSGGFSLNVPQAWFVHRENAGSNSLLSFTNREPAPNTMADAEVQVFRYRSATPERLTESNLEAIAGNFLSRLQASFAARKMSLVFGRPSPAPVSGRPGLVARVSSSGVDGATHEGEVLVTWHEDQVFVIAHAVRAENTESLSPLLASCARSFTLEVERGLDVPRGKPEDELKGLFETWKTAFRSFDFALYRELCLGGVDTTATRSAFVEMARRLASPEVRVTLGRIHAQDQGAEVECALVGPGSSETLRLAFAKTDAGWRLKS